MRAPRVRLPLLILTLFAVSYATAEAKCIRLPLNETAASFRAALLQRLRPLGITSYGATGTSGNGLISVLAGTRSSVMTTEENGLLLEVAADLPTPSTNAENEMLVTIGAFVGARFGSSSEQDIQDRLRTDFRRAANGTKVERSGTLTIAVTTTSDAIVLRIGRLDCTE